MNTPHVQLILDRATVPPPLRTALNRVKARVSVRSLEKARTRGVSPTADVCVLLPAGGEPADVLAEILAGASDQACATMVIPPAGTDAGAMWQGMDPRLGTGVGSLNADELTGRIRALCEIRHPLRSMREELRRLRRRDEQLTLDAREREQQLRLASQIQQDLLPEPLTDAGPLRVSTLYLPADHVSGDIYDIARLDETHFSFSLADATGHGMPAALLTILIKNSFRGKEIVGDTYRIIEPDEVLNRLNQELLQTSLSQCQFITGLHAVFDSASHELRFARGGSPYPVLLRPGEAPRQIRTAGGLMGVFENQTFEVGRIRLEPGDTLLFYTDGLEALLLGPQASCTDAAILRSDWLDRVRIDGPDAALEHLRTLAATRSDADWIHDDITAIALRL